MTMLAQVSKHRQAFSGPTSEAAGAEAAAAQVAEAPVDEEEEAQVDAEAPADGVADAAEADAGLQQEFALSAG